MHHLQNTYVKAFNRTHKRVGPLYQGRYKSIAVANLTYLKELTRYIHLNPLRQGLEKKRGRCEWSSYGFSIGQKNIPDWLSAGEVFNSFGSCTAEAVENHKHYVESGKDLPEWDPFTVAVEGIVIGSMKMLRGLLKDVVPADVHLSKGLLLNKLYTVEDVVTLLSEHDGIPVKKLVSRSFARTACRDAAVSLSRQHTTLSLRQLGAYFGGVSYGTIDLINRRCKAELETERNSEVSQIIRRMEKHLS